VLPLRHFTTQLSPNLTPLLQLNTKSLKKETQQEAHRNFRHKIHLRVFFEQCYLLVQTERAREPAERHPNHPHQKPAGHCSSQLLPNPVWYSCPSLTQKGHSFGWSSLKQSSWTSCLAFGNRSGAAALPAGCTPCSPPPTPQPWGSGTKPRQGTSTPHFCFQNKTHHRTHVTLVLLATLLKAGGPGPTPGYRRRTNSLLLARPEPRQAPKDLAQVHQHHSILPGTTRHNHHGRRSARGTLRTQPVQK